MSLGGSRNVWLIAKWEYFGRIKSKLFVFTTLLFPLIMIGLSYASIQLVESEGPGGLRLAIVDGDGTWANTIGQELDRRYTTADGKSIIPRAELELDGRTAQQQAAETLLEGDLIDAYLLIPVDFDQSGKIEFIGRSAAAVMEQALLRRTVQFVWTRNLLEQHGVSRRIADDLQNEISWTSLDMSGSERTDMDDMQLFFGPMMAVMILFFAIFISAQVLMRGIIAERGNKLVEMLLSSTSAQDLMTGKIIGLGGIGLTQITIYITIASLVRRRSGFDMIPNDMIPMLLVFAILGYFLYAALFAAVGSMFESEQDAQQVVGPLSILPVLPLLFLAYVITQPNALAVRIASFIPPMTPFVMIIRMAVTDLPAWEIAAAAGLLALSAWKMMRWAGVVFRTAILMYGKKVTLREIIRWLRVS